MKFIKFLLIWVSQNLTIPLWIVGHIHLSLSSYLVVENLFASLGMNLLVAIRLWLDWKKHIVHKIDHIHILTKMILENEKKINDSCSKVNRIIDEIKNMKIY